MKEMSMLARSVDRTEIVSEIKACDGWVQGKLVICKVEQC